MTVADVQLAQDLGVATLAPALFTRVEDRYAVYGNPDRAVDHRSSRGSDGRAEGDSPGIATFEESIKL